MLSRVPDDREVHYNNRLIEEARKVTSRSDASYYADWYTAPKEAKDILRERIEGKGLVDLGGNNGQFLDGLKEGRTHIRPRYYVNVEKYFFKGVNAGENEGETQNGFKYFHWKEKGRRVSQDPNKIHVDADMLDFLQHVPNESLDAITLNGIESDNIGHSGYHEALAQQIKRVLRSKGIIFGSTADALPILRAEGLKELWGGTPYFAILEKT